MRRLLLNSTAIPRAPATEGNGGAPVDDDFPDSPEPENEEGDGEGEFEEHEGEPLPEHEPGAPEETAEPVQQQAGRSSETIRTLRARAQEAERLAGEANRRAEETSRRLQDIERQTQRQQELTPAQEDALLAEMSAEQRADYRVNKALEQFRQTQAVESFRNLELTDRQSFTLLRKTDTLADRYADEVERELQKIRADGGNVPREAVLNYVVGRALRNKQAQTAGRRTSEAQTRIRRQTTRPGNSRSDTGAARRGATSLEQRLENVPI